LRILPGQVSSSPEGLTDSLRAARPICEHDPTLVVRHRERFRELFGGMHAAAGDATADQHPIEASPLLATGVVRHRHWTRQMPRSLFKVLMPRRLLGLLRGHRTGR